MTTESELLSSAPLLRSAAGLCGGPSSGALLGGLTTRRGFPPGDHASAEQGRASIREFLAHALSLSPDRFAWCKQVHGSRVFRARRPGLQGEGDAMVSSDPSLGLLIAVADCMPVLLWTPGRGPLGAAHAGWRGLIEGILPATVSALEELDVRPDRLHAWIGPSISVEHFEVDEDVASRFPSAVVHRKESWTKPHLDLKVLAREQLVEAGLVAERVAVCPDCTFSREELYFSYRRDHGICGRHLAYLVRRT